MHKVLRAAWFVTDFADQAVVLPLALMVAILLYAAGWRRGALVWSLMVTATFGLMLLLKVAFGVCGDALTGGYIESPSGHTAAAGVIYGSIVAFFIEQVFGRTLLSLAAVLLIVVVVGCSRVLLGAHTVGEVIIGAGVGIVAALIMVRGVGRPEFRSPFVLLLLPLCAVLFMFHGLHFRAEASIRSFSRWVTPFTICRQSEIAGARMPALE